MIIIIFSGVMLPHSSNSEFGRHTIPLQNFFTIAAAAVAPFSVACLVFITGKVIMILLCRRDEKQFSLTFCRSHIFRKHCKTLYCYIQLQTQHVTRFRNDFTLSYELKQ